MSHIRACNAQTPRSLLTDHWAFLISTTSLGIVPCGAPYVAEWGVVCRCRYAAGSPMRRISS